MCLYVHREYRHMMLSVVGLSAVAFNSGLADASVPMLLLVQNGVGSAVLTPIISVLIILGAVSTLSI